MLRGAWPPWWAEGSEGANPTAGSFPRELVEGSSCSSVSPFMPFSWFTDSGKGSASSGSTVSPTRSPKREGLSPKKSASQVSTHPHLTL